MGWFLYGWEFRGELILFRGDAVGINSPRIYTNFTNYTN